jgi:hypothetical protein
MKSEYYIELAADVNSQRISQQNLRSLKVAETAKAKTWVRFNAWAGRAFTQLPNLLSIFVRAEKNNPCDYNGHVISQRRWNGVRPVCDDCGAEIFDHSIMRKTDIAAIGLTVSNKHRKKFWTDEGICA